MFNFLKKKQDVKVMIELPPLEADGEKEVICSPLEGEAVKCVEIRDRTFREEMLGKSIAIKPTVGKVYAPADGKIEMIIESLHALSMTSAKGAEIMIHVGIDTVALGGKHFKSYVKEGSVVKRGDLLLEFNMDAITAAGYDLISPVIICNSEEYVNVEKVTGKMVKVGETIMKLAK